MADGKGLLTMDEANPVAPRGGETSWDIFNDGCPQGGMPCQIPTRADRLIACLRLLSGNVALFSHGQFGGVPAARWIGLPLAVARHFPSGTASISILGHDPYHPDVSVISLWNSISHLRLNSEDMDQHSKIADEHANRVA